MIFTFNLCIIYILHVDFLAKYLYTKHELGFLQKCFQYLKIVCLESMLSTKNRLNAHFQKKNVRIKSINSYILSSKNGTSHFWYLLIPILDKQQ